MKNEKKQDMTAELAEGKILPLVFKLTIPAVIAQLITFLYNIVDRMYVARIEGSAWMRWPHLELFFQSRSSCRHLQI